jgi:hypothetical protein
MSRSTAPLVSHLSLFCTDVCGGKFDLPRVQGRAVRILSPPGGLCGGLIDSKEVGRGSNLRDPSVFVKTGQMGRECECVIGTRD